MPITPPTMPSPIIVRALVPGTPHPITGAMVPGYRFLWMPVARLVDEKTGEFVRFVSAKVFPKQEFEYVGDPAGLETDPHVAVVSDPDKRVPAAIKARYAKRAADLAARKRREAAMRGEEPPAELPPPAPALPAGATSAPPAQRAPRRGGRPPKAAKEPTPAAPESAPAAPPA